MKPIIDELYQIIQNKKKPIVVDNPSTLEHLEAALLNKECSRILSKYCFENLPKSMPCLDTDMRSIYYLMRDILIFGAIFLIGFILYLIHFCCIGSITRVLFVIGYGLIAGTALTSFHAIAHECMHEIFLTNKNINHIVGFIISTLLGIPYHSVCFSHAKHHRYVNHLFYGETMIPYNVAIDSKDEHFHKDIFHYIKKIIIQAKFKLYTYNRGIFALVNIILTLLFGVDLYLLFNVGGGRIDYRTKKEIKCNQPRDHYRSNSVIFLESQENFVRLSTLGIIALWLTVICVFSSYPMTTFCFYILPRLISNAWIVMYSWIAHTDMNVPYYGPKAFNRFKSNISVISSSYGLFLDHLHHHIGLNATIHHLCPQIPHYLCRSFITTIRDDILSDARLIDMYSKLDELYPTYRKLMTCIKGCSTVMKELGIMTETNSNNLMTQVSVDLDQMNDKDYFRKMCLNRTDISSVKKLRSLFQSVKKYEKRLEDTFCEFELTLTLTNLIEMIRICKQDDCTTDDATKRAIKMDEFTVDMLVGPDCVSQGTYLTSSKNKSSVQNTLTLKKFVDTYRYKQNVNSILEKLVQNSIMCQFIKEPMDRTVYYQGFNSVH